MAKMTAWDWAFQFAVRRSCWKAVESIIVGTKRSKSTRNFQQRPDDISRSDETNKAIEMILSDPIVSPEAVKESGVADSYFWHISYLFDNTNSVSPAIVIPTLAEIEDNARRARYIASTEPHRPIKPECYYEDKYEVPCISDATDPDYIAADALLDGDPLILFLRTGNTPAALKREFGLFIDKYTFERNKGGTNPNDLKTDDLADLYLLAFIDLKIWTRYTAITFYEPSEIAWIIGDAKISSAKVSKRIAPLADRLLDYKSRQSQELLRLAAAQRNADRVTRTYAKRGPRPKTK